MLQEQDWDAAGPSTVAMAMLGLPWQARTLSPKEKAPEHPL